MIREAVLSDAEFILDITRKAFGKRYLELEELKYHIENPDDVMFIHEDEGERDAALLYKRENKESIMRDLIITEEELAKFGGPENILHGKFICVEESRRGKGVGHELLAEALDRFREDVPGTLLYGILWKYDGKVPVLKACQDVGYEVFKELKSPWYYLKDAYCSYCKGRCKCDGVAVIKRV